MILLKTTHIGLLLVAPALLAQAQVMIVTASLPFGAIGQQYSANLTASDGTPPYRWGANGQLPPGLSMDATGTIAGIPSSNGNYSFFVTVSDNAQGNASKQFTIAIGATAQQLAISTTTLPVATVGQSYSQQLSATGGTPPYRWSTTSLPGGLTLSSAGLLGWHPGCRGYISDHAAGYRFRRETRDRSIDLDDSAFAFEHHHSTSAFYSYCGRSIYTAVFGYRGTAAVYVVRYIRKHRWSNAQSRKRQPVRRPRSRRNVQFHDKSHGYSRRVDLRQLFPDGQYAGANYSGRRLSGGRNRRAAL